MQKNTDLSLHENNLLTVSYLNGNNSDNRTSFTDAWESERLDQHISEITFAGKLSGGGITIFDVKRNTHVYASVNFFKIWGYKPMDLSLVPNEIFDERVHPKDLVELKNNGIAAMKFMEKIPSHLYKHYKMTTEYRILSPKNEGYIRVIEQHQELDKDASGSSWLSLGLLDISPNQSIFTGVTFQILNLASGELIDISPAENVQEIRLTTREKQIIEMVRDGQLSKEISSALKISLHTVNTHRQRILGKLNADNSIEAVSAAKRLGIIK